MLFRKRGLGAQAEDLAQESLCRLLENPPAFNEPNALVMWVFGIAKNVGHEGSKARSRDNQTVSLDLAAGVAQKSPPADIQLWLFRYQIRERLASLLAPHAATVLEYYLGDKDALQWILRLTRSGLAVRIYRILRGKETVLVRSAPLDTAAVLDYYLEDAPGLAAKLHVTASQLRARIRETIECARGREDSGKSSPAGNHE
jgi:hypothetical protein